MLKRRIVAVVVGLTLLVAAVGSSGIVADALGFSVTPQTQACSNGNGGDC